MSADRQISQWAPGPNGSGLTYVGESSEVTVSEPNAHTHTHTHYRTRHRTMGSIRSEVGMILGGSVYDIGLLQQTRIQHFNMKRLIV